MQQPVKYLRKGSRESEVSPALCEFSQGCRKKNSRKSPNRESPDTLKGWSPRAKGQISNKGSSPGYGRLEQEESECISLQEKSLGKGKNA